VIHVALYVAQRATAAIMAPLVLVHLATMIYAVDGGLSAGEILARTQGSVAWGLFYGLFVVAAAVHAAIGVHTVLVEWTPLGGRGANVAAALLGLVLLSLGLRAVAAVVL
jgi:fumarate reductase subunit C